MNDDDVKRLREGGVMETETRPGPLYAPPPPKTQRTWVWPVIAGVLALVTVVSGAVLFASLGSAREKATELEDQLQASREQVAALEGTVGQLEVDVDEARNEADAADAVTSRVQRILVQAQRCAYHLLGAVDAVDGAFGTEDWTTFYRSIDLALPACERAAQDAGVNTL